MNYTLNQLRIFLKIAQTGSVTKAAEALHLTQPAVSIQLKNLQQQFEIPLTEVISKRIYITDFGRQIATAAENILNEVYAINYQSSSFQQQLVGRLKISVVSTGKYVMPNFLSGFLKQHSAVELEMDVTNRANVIMSLEENMVDFSLVSVIPEGLKLERIELMPNRIFLIGNNNSKFGAKNNKLNLLENIPLIFREQGSATRFTMENFIKKNNLQVSKRIILSSNEAVKQAVLAGLGYSIMPLIGIRNELKLNQLQIIPIKGLPEKTNWNLIWHADKKLSPVAAAFAKYLQEEKKKIIDSVFYWLKDY
jgi:DNA-binding transcriptional LysR family regulator